MKLIFAALLVSTQAFAWGPTGHRAVAEIAQKRLDVNVGLKVFNLLGGRSLAQVANWPDEIRSEPEKYGYTFPWHSTEWTDDQKVPDEEHSYGKLITALNQQLAVLKDPASTDDKKVVALKFLVHLLADLHQPLHVGNNVDQGGNICKVKFHNRVTNLHAVWDEAMIDFTRLSYTELAKFSEAGRTIEEVRAYKQGGILDWAVESREIRKIAYPADTASYCKKGYVDENVMPNLGYEYSYKFMPVVEQRIYQAGLRLAVLLNDTLK